MKLLIIVLPTISLTFALGIPHLTSGFGSRHQILARAGRLPGEPAEDVSPRPVIPYPHEEGPFIIDFSHLGNFDGILHSGPSYPIEERIVDQGEEDSQSGISSWKDSESEFGRDSPGNDADDEAEYTSEVERQMNIRNDFENIGGSIATFQNKIPEMEGAKYRNWQSRKRQKLRAEARGLYTKIVKTEDQTPQSPGLRSPVTMAFDVPQRESIQFLSFIKDAVTGLGGNGYLTFPVHGRVPTPQLDTLEPGDTENLSEEDGPPTIGRTLWRLFSGFVEGKPERRRFVRPQRMKRQALLSNIQTAEDTPSPGAAKTTDQMIAEFERYLSAFQIVQANVSEILFPFLDTIMAGTNSSLVHGAAWSIYADLTGSSPFVIGPFLHGLNCLEWLEDKYINSTNGSQSSPNMSDAKIVEMFAINGVLLDIYDTAWSNGSAAVKNTGLLTDMVTLSRYLTPSNMSVLPPGFENYTAPTYDSSYFKNGTSG